MSDEVPPGTRVEKINTGAGDVHGDGDRATVLRFLTLSHEVVGYVIEWDDAPGLGFFIAGHRLRLVTEQRGPQSAAG